MKKALKLQKRSLRAFIFACHAKIPACPRINSNVGTQFLGQGFMFLFYINKFPIWKTRADTTHANSVV